MSGCSSDIDEDAVVVWGHSPVLTVVVLVWIVLLVVGKEGIKGEALSEVLGGLEAADVVEHVEVAVGVDAATEESVPVDTLQLQVGLVLLEVEVHGTAEVDVWALDAVLVLTSHHKLVHVEILWEHLHFSLSNSRY